MYDEAIEYQLEEIEHEYSKIFPDSSLSFRMLADEWENPCVHPLSHYFSDQYANSASHRGEF